MKDANLNKNLENLTVGSESPVGISVEGVAATDVSVAQLGPIGEATATIADSGKAGPPKRNRSGVEKRKARRA